MAQMVVQQLQEIGALQTNAKALVNAGIVDMQQQKFAAARVKFERALHIQPDCFEANYNLGLCAMQQQQYDISEEIYEHIKVDLLDAHSLQHNHVIYQLARIQEHKMSTKVSSETGSGALQSYLQVLGISQPDSKLYEKIAYLYEQMHDHQGALQYYNEAHRINPSDIEISNSLGSYYVKLQSTEKAIYYYERAVMSNPNDPQLMLRIASCLRHSYMPPKQYLGVFEKIHTLFPDSVACVRALMQVTKSIGMNDIYEKYAAEYSRLQQLEQHYQQQRMSSARARTGSSRLRAQRQQLQHRTSEEYFAINNMQQQQQQQQQHNTIIESSLLQVNHIDPLGPPAQRPLTGRANRPGTHKNNNYNDIDEFYDDYDDLNAENLLPI